MDSHGLTRAKRVPESRRRLCPSGCGVPPCPPGLEASSLLYAESGWGFAQKAKPAGEPYRVSGYGVSPPPSPRAWRFVVRQVADGWAVPTASARPRAAINDLWYKNAIIYCLSVGTYMDANGDGIGDFGGLMRRLDYLHGLGITAIWLMPFQTSPGRDNGYDVSDYYGVNPAYGTLGDFVEF